MSSSSFIRAQNVSTGIPRRSEMRSALRKNPVAVVADIFANRETRGSIPLISGLTFDVRAGERIGLIGQNGAGKTTLLRLLAGALMPSSGRLEICGTTQKLLTTAMGMEPQATGIENIYLLGYSSGLSARKIDELLPEIVDFANLGDVLQNPVNTYSSGMRLRLAFSVATAVKPEILLLDEWLSTGDRYFVKRANERLMSHIDSSEILVFASHSNDTLAKVCTRGLVLKGGRAVFDGGIEDAIKFYESDDYQSF